MNKTEKGIVGGLAALAAFFGIKKWVAAAPQEPEVCTPGETKCEGFDLYECSGEGKWVRVEENSPSCGWEPGEAEFEVSDLVIEPATVNVGEPVSISVLVTNIGEKAGTKTVMLQVS